MAPAIQRVLQTAAQKHNAAPTPFRKRRNLVPSPLVAFPEVGIVFSGRQKGRDGLPPPFLFRPTLHAAFERSFESAKKPMAMKMNRDIKRINQLLPIDILMRSLKQQAARAQPPLQPVPIRLKLSPQMRRVKNKRYFKRPRLHRKRPECGHLIPVVQKPSVTIEQIMSMPSANAVEATPYAVAKMLVTRLLDLRPHVGIHGSLSEVIAVRRRILYLEEGAAWMSMFIPGASEDDPHIPPVFKMFDNTDKGIPGELMQKRDTHGSLTTYQFRVLSKRHALRTEMDLYERVLFAEILGMTEEEVHCFFLRTRLDEEMKGMTERQIRTLFYRTYKAALQTVNVDEDDCLVVVRMYKKVMYPIIGDAFRN